MIEEPRIALAASPREWAQRLHRHVADHGGARVRATVLHPRDALEEDYDVFLVDDTTSYLTPRFVAQLRERGRAVLGVFDPADPRGKDDLLGAGVEDVLPRDASPQEFVDAIATIAGRTPVLGEPTAARVARRAHVAVPPAPRAGRQAYSGAAGAGDRAAAVPGRLTVVAATTGGAGATEVAVALADASGQRGEPTLLVDGDDAAPALAQRLALPTYPNVRAAVDALHRGGAALGELPLPAPGGWFEVLPGIGSSAGWSELRPAETVEALRALAATRRQVVVDASGRLEDLQAFGAPARNGLARHLAASADALVAVAQATPVALRRLLEWVADVRELAPDTPVHVLCNRAPSSAYKRGEFLEELTRVFAPASLWFAPADPRVEAAAWEGGVPASGPFMRAIGSAVPTVLPGRSVGRRGRRRRR